MPFLGKAILSFVALFTSIGPFLADWRYLALPLPNLPIPTAPSDTHPLPSAILTPPAKPTSRIQTGRLTPASTMARP